MFCVLTKEERDRMFDRARIKLKPLIIKAIEWEKFVERLENDDER